MGIKHRFAPFETPEWSLVEMPESEFNRISREFFSRSVDRSRLIRDKRPQAALKSWYRKTLEQAAAVILAFLILFFQLSRLFGLTPQLVDDFKFIVVIDEVPPTTQFRLPPPPPRPSVPIPSEDEMIPADATIVTTELNLEDLPPPPEPPDEGDGIPLFIPYDEPPAIIGGMAALMQNIEYPGLAIKADIEGTVYVRVLVGVDGRTERVDIIKADPANFGFEDAAIKALKKVRWKPARQRENAIRVWATIPVLFRLVVNNQ
ncbi:MAG: energy transducer TonB [bacterium]